MLCAHINQCFYTVPHHRTLTCYFGLKFYSLLCFSPFLTNAQLLETLWQLPKLSLYSLTELRNKGIKDGDSNITLVANSLIGNVALQIKMGLQTEPQIGKTLDKQRQPCSGRDPHIVEESLSSGGYGEAIFQ